MKVIVSYRSQAVHHYKWEKNLNHLDNLNPINSLSNIFVKIDIEFKGIISFLVHYGVGVELCMCCCKIFMSTSPQLSPEGALDSLVAIFAHITKKCDV